MKKEFLKTKRTFFFFFESESQAKLRADDLIRNPLQNILPTVSRIAKR